MIRGHVSDHRVPLTSLDVDGEEWQAIIDTGFNGDLELPDALRDTVNARYTGRISSALAGGQTIDEDAYLVEFPFDGEVVQATATFVDGAEILIGTNLLRQHRLEIRFARRTVQLERE